ncbi:MAG TPA: SET domain-containing protein [Pseudolabrys sp.]|nr:SET domain-containing protein [Pseudolabrys sp.]
MLLVKTYLDKSPIHGLGVFAGELIPKGTKIWRFVEGFDHCYSASEFARLPKPARDFIEYYGYQIDGEILLTGDNDRHMNHAEQPNTCVRGAYTVARIDIPEGVEITADYRDFELAMCASFLRDATSARADSQVVQQSAEM